MPVIRIDKNTQRVKDRIYTINKCNDVMTFYEELLQEAMEEKSLFEAQGIFSGKNRKDTTHKIKTCEEKIMNCKRYLGFVK